MTPEVEADPMRRRVHAPRTSRGWMPPAAQAAKVMRPDTWKNA